MEKLLLIVKREYINRVRRRSFILATLLTPLGLAVFLVVASLIFQYQGDDVQRIAVIDTGNVLNRAIPDEENLLFQFVDADLEQLKAVFDTTKYDGILEVPPIDDLLSTRHTVFYYSDKVPSLEMESLIRSRLADRIREFKIDALDLERKELDALNPKVDLQPRTISETDSSISTLSSAIGAAIGFLMGMIMYMTVFVYGTMVLRSVMEEKTSRIVEVMISSVRPFQLMLGKIIGVGAVGLTQVAIWAVLIPLVIFIVTLLFGFDSASLQSQSPQAAAAGLDPDDTQAKIALAISEFKNQNWGVMLLLFVLYFLGGYFLYSSLFAAVGSAMSDDLGEGQSLTIPISIPVILAFYIMVMAIQSPNSSLAVWSSIFPLFSPIVMPARLAFEPPVWQVLLSLVVLFLAAVFFIWLSGRIYRVGILMYGKKVSLRELGRWMFIRD
jgi:ABC-2 type transport system permease protein